MTTVTEREHCPFCGAVTCTYRTTLRPRLVHFIRKLPRDVLVGMSDENLTVGEVMALEDRR